MLNKRKLSLLWTYYKSTLLINVVCSAAVPFANFPEYIQYFPQLFSLSFVTFGLIVSLVYKEFVRREEYYFYYNGSVSRLQLYLACLFVNIPVSVTIILFVV